MSIISKIRKARVEAKAEAKAAKSRALAEVKANAKAQRRQEKLLARQERALLKTEAKGLKNKRKHEYKLAKTELDKLREGRFNANNVRRYSGALRAAAPLLLPLAYRGLTALRQQLENNKAKNSGVTPDQLASFSGHGAPLKAQIQGIRNSLEDTNVPAGFKRDVRDQLKELDAAVDNAEYMTPQQRVRAHSSIKSDIEKVTNDIQQRITQG